MKQEEWLIAYIDSAFDGVTLEDGKDIYEAKSDDEYGNPEELLLSKTAERLNWRLVPHEDLHYRGFWAIGYLDAKGLLFYAPAIMTALLTPGGRRSGLASGFMTHFRVQEDGTFRGVPFAQMFTSSQSAAIIRFLKFFVHNSYACGDSSEAADRLLEFQLWT